MDPKFPPPHPKVLEALSKFMKAAVEPSDEANTDEGSEDPELVDDADEFGGEGDYIDPSLGWIAPTQGSVDFQGMDEIVQL